MERSEELRELTWELYRTMAGADVAGLQRLMSRQDGVLMFGTDPQERWEGYERIMSVFRTQTEELGGGVPIKGSDPQAFVEGSVGWVDDDPVIELGPEQRLPCRMTMVLHREDGAWKCVQAHFSLGVPNEEAFGQELGG